MSENEQTSRYGQRQDREIFQREAHGAHERADRCDVKPAHRWQEGSHNSGWDKRQIVEEPGGSSKIANLFFPCERGEQKDSDLVAEVHRKQDSGKRSRGSHVSPERTPFSPVRNFGCRTLNDEAAEQHCRPDTDDLGYDESV